MAFKQCSKALSEIIQKGAEKKWNMEYMGVVQTGELVGESAVGPQAWRSRDGVFILLMFTGAEGAEYDLIQSDPESDVEIKDFMDIYGHSPENLIKATRVAFTEKAGSNIIVPDGSLTVVDAVQVGTFSLNGVDIYEYDNHATWPQEFNSVSDKIGCSASNAIMKLTFSNAIYNIKYLQVQADVKTNLSSSVWQMFIKTDEGGNTGFTPLNAYLASKDSDVEETIHSEWADTESYGFGPYRNPELWISSKSLFSAVSELKGLKLNYVYKDFVENTGYLAEPDAIASPAGNIKNGDTITSNFGPSFMKCFLFDATADQTITFTADPQPNVIFIYDSSYPNESENFVAIKYPNEGNQLIFNPESDGQYRLVIVAVNEAETEVSITMTVT